MVKYLKELLVFSLVDDEDDDDYQGDAYSDNPCDYYRG